MEWVEKTGKSVQEAKDQALDHLGVAEHDAEVVVLSEPKTGLFGRVRGEARVRVRVRPAEPRPKRQRRPRERSRGGRASGARGGDTREAPRASGRGANERPSERGSGGRGRSVSPRTSVPDAPDAPDAPNTSNTSNGTGAPGTGTSAASRRRRRRRAAAARTGDGGPASPEERANGAGASGPERPERAGRDPEVAGRTARERGTQGARPPRREETTEEGTVSEGVTLQEQGETAKAFIEGLLDRFGLEATVEVHELDEQTVEVSAKGEGLGVLVGPKGATLASLQDVTRTVVQRRFPHRTDRILVDVAGYRERRAAALRRFAQQVASEVLEAGTERALEPMSPADRKVVHDTVVEIEGVTSSSQGEEPHRFVVISPGS